MILKCLQLNYFLCEISRDFPAIILLFLLHTGVDFHLYFVGLVVCLVREVKLGNSGEKVLLKEY